MQDIYGVHSLYWLMPIFLIYARSSVSWIETADRVRCTRAIVTKKDSGSPMKRGYSHKNKNTQYPQYRSRALISFIIPTFNKFIYLLSCRSLQKLISTMGKPQARKKQHKGDKPLKEKYRTRRKTKDLDQIFEDMLPKNANKLLHQEVDFDKAGNAQFYCLHCALVLNIH
jgi:hypothetical protein